MPVPTHLILRAAACLSAAFLSAGCSSSDARAQQALTAYQAAAASNDLVSARRALLQLVRAKDDVADYWVELGKVQASMGSYGDAYYAFTRAYELDRSNVDVLRMVVQLALRSGDVALAQSRAQELDVLSPGDPWVRLTKGWAAVSETRFDEALSEADKLLATSPYDSAGTVLKARALIGLDRQDEAVEVLNKQIQAQPSDAGSLQLLAKIYVRRGDWPRTADTAQRLTELIPTESNNWLLLIEAAFRSGNVPEGRRASAHLLQPNAEPTMIVSVLDLWNDYWNSPQRLQDARTFGLAAGLQQRAVYAAFLSRAGDTAGAIRLIAPNAGLPVKATNAEANAVVADAWLRTGKLSDARRRFDAVLAYDPGNATALRGRSELQLRTGNAAGAIEDAQKLVTVLPNSAADRLLLARCYSAAGNRPWVERTLWAAFQEIPANEKIFAALQATKKGNEEASLDLQQEFARQREAKLSRGLL